MARRPSIIKAKSSKKTTRAPRRGVNRFSLMPTDNWDKARFFAHYDLERKDCGTKVKEYIKKNFAKDVLTKINRLPDWKVDMHSHWAATAHLLEVNPDLVPDGYKAGIVKWIETLALEGAELTAKKEETEGETKPKKVVNIQEIMREKADEALSDIEALFDEFIDANCPKDFSVNQKVVGALTTRNVLPQHMATAIKRYQRLLDEYLEVQGGKCDQLNEGYSHYSKMQIRYSIKFIEDVIAAMNGYIGLKQAAKKPRAKKAVPVERVVAKLKHCKSFKDDALKLELVGLSPVKLHESTEAWVYDTAKRKMHHYVADAYSKCLMVKGNTIIGFDKKESGMKTLRKPVEQIKAIMGSKPAARKYFSEIKAVEAVPNGRFNTGMIILKAF
jgi:phage FluMu protein Com